MVIQKLLLTGLVVVVSADMLSQSAQADTRGECPADIGQHYILAGEIQLIPPAERDPQSDQLAKQSQPSTLTLAGGELAAVNLAV